MDNAELHLPWQRLAMVNRFREDLRNTSVLHIELLANACMSLVRKRALARCGIFAPYVPLRVRRRESRSDGTYIASAKGGSRKRR